MYFIYNLFIYFSFPLILPYLVLKSIKRKGSLSGISERFGFYPNINIGDKKVIWIHSVSVGEVIASIPLVMELKKRYPNYSLVMSTVTETGRATAINKIPFLNAVVYFPFDLPFSVKNAIDKIKPVVFVMLETEIWPNFLRALRGKGIPAILINGRISDRSYKRYLRVRFFIKEVLKNICVFGMQSAADTERIINMGADKEKVERTGNLKFEHEARDISSDTVKKLKESLNITEDKDIIIAGSTHRGEDEEIIKAYQTISKAARELPLLIIAPRHLDRLPEIEDILKRYNLSFIRKTMIKKSEASSKYHVILLDTIGELSTLYSIASVVFVGGSLVPVGGHNILEPALYKKPVLFGPYMHNFKEIAEGFKNKKAAIEINSSDEMAREIINILNNPDIGRELGERGFSVVVENKGALEKSIGLIGRFL
ncbi:MAG: 3-deoxy-D-manno-octulosonic acid transferase [Nitrospirae bacterium]|nr:3-deoxy-D-manno-octulosonic acid transferase [Nitrospirota bacterium]